MFWFSGRKAYGILAPQRGIEPAPLILEGEVLTTGLQGKSQEHRIYLLPYSKLFFPYSLY